MISSQTHAIYWRKHLSQKAEIQALDFDSVQLEDIDIWADIVFICHMSRDKCMMPSVFDLFW